MRPSTNVDTRRFRIRVPSAAMLCPAVENPPRVSERDGNMILGNAFRHAPLAKLVVTEPIFAPLNELIGDSQRDEIPRNSAAVWLHGASFDW